MKMLLDSHWHHLIRSGSSSCAMILSRSSSDNVSRWLFSLTTGRKTSTGLWAELTSTTDFRLLSATLKLNLRILRLLSIKMLPALYLHLHIPGLAGNWLARWSSHSLLWTSLSRGIQNIHRIVFLFSVTLSSLTWNQSIQLESGGSKGEFSVLTSNFTLH